MGARLHFGFLHRTGFSEPLQLQKFSQSKSQPFSAVVLGTTIIPSSSLTMRRLRKEMESPVLPITF
jgi:hypothetical protein